MAPLVVTYSDIDAFLACRRAWFWSYVMDFQLPKKVHGALALGSRVHNVLEYMYSNPEVFDPFGYHDTLAGIDAAWQEENDAPEWAKEELYSDIVIGRNVIRHYLDWLSETGADSGLEVVSTEEIVETSILDGAVILRGKVDIKFRRIDSGLLILNDWKTAGRWDTAARTALERSYQHHVYMAVENLTHPDDPVTEAWYTVLKKVKTRRPSGPIIERFKVPGTRRSAPGKLKQVEAVVVEMLRAIEMESQFPSPGKSCAWCDFKIPCELADDAPEVALEFLGTRYDSGGKHDRYSAMLSPTDTDTEKK